MEDFRVDVCIADGPHAQTIPMALERFTLIGATTRFGLLTPPMRARFGLVERLSYYPPDDLAQIIGRSAGILDVPADPAGIAEIARRSRGTPPLPHPLPTPGPALPPQPPRGARPVPDAARSACHDRCSCIGRPTSTTPCLPSSSPRSPCPTAPRAGCSSWTAGAATCAIVASRTCSRSWPRATCSSSTCHG